MAESEVVVCPKCGKEIREAARFCPNCAEPLPQPQQDPNIGYWNFYGAFGDDDLPPEPQGLGARGTLRFLAVAVLAVALILGFILTSSNWHFSFSRAWPYWAAGAGAAVVLFGVSFLCKKRE